jgi:radical SAM protein with 4Fe4S-binding SPASM domain
MRICNHSPTILGNLTEQSFEEIWQHPLLQKFRNNQIIPKECQSCKQKFECRGGCRAVAETYYGDILAPDPLMFCAKK